MEKQTTLAARSCGKEQNAEKQKRKKENKGKANTEYAANT